MKTPGMNQGIDVVDILFPRSLHGNAIQTRAAWKDTFDWAQDSGCWELPFASLDFVRINEVQGSIILNDEDDGLTARRDVHWRLYWLPRLFSSTNLPMAIENEIEKQRALILAGMRFPWFVISMLIPDIQSPTFMELRGPNCVDAFFYPLLCSYIYWLPEVKALEHRYSIGLGEVLSLKDQLEADYRWMHFEYLVYLMRMCGYDLDWEEFKARMLSHDGNVIRVLEASEIIKSCGDRYELTK